MNPRIVFPVIMFALAAASFAYGAWEHFAAQRIQTAADQRLAFVVSSIAHAPVAAAQKQALYASIFSGLPPAPSLLGIDLSGSFAAQQAGDQCRNDGQRAVCRALRTTDSDAQTVSAVCGVCDPQ